MKPLFVAGCQRSGTTALVEYLNQCPEVLVCRERYKYIPRRVTLDHLSFERILAYSPEETNVPEEQFVELLESKEPEKLKWIGDKNPDYYKHLEGLLSRNPGARFIVLYRPLEEVAESFQARAEDVRDHWPARYDYEMSVKLWNLALHRTREFVEGGQGRRVLILDYHGFFRLDEADVTSLARFLEIGLGEATLSTWKERSASFDGARRRKQALGEQQRAFVLENRDRAAEEWILERIARQHSAPGEVFPEQPDSLQRAEIRRPRESDPRLLRRLASLGRGLSRALPKRGGR